MAKIIHLVHAFECEFCGDLTDEVIDYGNMICQECFVQHREEQKEDHESDYWDRIIDERKGKL